MRKVAMSLAAVAALSFCVKFASAADQKITGVLIDDHCAAKFMKKDNPQKAAEAHKAACALKCTKDGGAFVLISGKEELKLDSHGQELAKSYLEKNKDTKVVINGEKSGDELKVESIEKAPAAG